MQKLKIFFQSQQHFALMHTCASASEHSLSSKRDEISYEKASLSLLPTTTRAWWERCAATRADTHSPFFPHFRSYGKHESAEQSEAGAGEVPSLVSELGRAKLATACCLGEDRILLTSLRFFTIFLCRKDPFLMGRPRRLKPQEVAGPQSLYERHHQMIRLALVGRTQREIADILGCTQTTVSLVLNGELAREQLAVLKTAADTKAVDIARMLQEEAPKCLELLKQIRDNDTESLGEVAPLSLRMNAAESLLDRGGTSRVQNIRALVGHAIVTEDVLADIKQKAADAKNLAKAAGALVVDFSAQNAAI